MPTIGWIGQEVYGGELEVVDPGEFGNPTMPNISSL